MAETARQLGYTTAADRLAEALQGVAPHLSKVVAGQLGEYLTVELAQAIQRAVHVAPAARRVGSGAVRGGEPL